VVTEFELTGWLAAAQSTDAIDETGPQKLPE
jgi:hypothetical protein